MKFAAVVMVLLDSASASALAQGGSAAGASGSGQAGFWISVAGMVLSLFCAIIIILIAFVKLPKIADHASVVREDTGRIRGIKSKIDDLETHFEKSLKAIESWKAESGRIETHIKGVPGLVKKHMDEKLGVFETLQPRLDQIVGSLKTDLAQVQDLLDRYKSDLKDRIVEHDQIGRAHV